MHTLKTYWEKSWVKHLLFWLAVYSFFGLSKSITPFGSYRFFYENYLLILFIEIVAAYSILYWLLPRYLNQKKYLQFAFGLLLLLFTLYAVYMAVREFYFDVRYADLYDEFAQKYLTMTYVDRLLDFKTFLSKSLLFLGPTALLLMLRSYRDQQQYLKLSQQKKEAELSALKHQLNPHFLFNTLNNLYSLALKKSDKTAEVIERLSGILDYILYRCNEDFVPIANEVKLIENYLALEKVRYGQRVAIQFSNTIEDNVKIAPLLLLTFIENAFKHGVSQELKLAEILIDLRVDPHEIVFSISNTKPVASSTTASKNEAIGLNNIKQQLDLLYPSAYDLQIDEQDDRYSVLLKLARV